MGDTCEGRSVKEMNIDQFVIVAVALTAFALALVLAVLLIVYRRLRAALKRRSEELTETAARLRAESDERRKRERDLSDTRWELERHKQFFEELFLQSTVATQIFDRAGNRLRVNGEWYRLFDLRDRGRPYNIFEDPAIQRAGLDAAMRRVVTEGITAEWEVPLETGHDSGRTHWFRIRAFPVSGTEGAIAYMIVHYEDVTDRRRADEEVHRALEEKELLLKEIHHRVKNNMQLMKSMLNLQAGYVTDPATLAMFTESANRINTMALIHEKLYQTDTFGRVPIREYLTYIADRLYQTYARPQREILIRTELDDVELDLDTAIPCGLLANELISNALKHAFDGRSRGALLVSFQKVDPSLDGAAHRSPAYLLAVSDNGRGLPPTVDENAPDSLGLKLVSSLVAQLDGELVVNDRPRSGTVVEVKFPLSRETKSPAAGVQQGNGIVHG